MVPMDDYNGMLACIGVLIESGKLCLNGTIVLLGVSKGWVKGDTIS